MNPKPNFIDLELAEHLKKASGYTEEQKQCSGCAHRSEVGQQHQDRAWQDICTRFYSAEIPSLGVFRVNPKARCDMWLKAPDASQKARGK